MARWGGDRQWRWKDCLIKKSFKKKKKRSTQIKSYRNMKEKSEERKENVKKQTADLSLRGRGGSLVRVDTWPLLLLSSIPSLFSTLSRSRSLSPPSTWAWVQRQYRHEARRWWGWGGGSFITLSLNLCISFSSCRQGSVSIVFKQGMQSRTNWTQLLFPAAWMPEELVQQCAPWK